MARYIDADELKNAFTNWREIVNNPYDFFPSVEECKAVIDAQPTAEVAEIKRGRWKMPAEYGDEYTCSVCGEITRRNRTPYCGWCGAKMEVENV